MPPCFLATLYAPSPSVRGLGEDRSQALVRSRRLNVDADAVAAKRGAAVSSAGPWLRAACEDIPRARAATWVFEQRACSGSAPPWRLACERLRSDR